MLQSPENKNNILFYVLLTVILGFFLWSRIDLSDRLYYFGDGTAIVTLIQLMLDTGNWDPDWYRLVGVMHVDDDIKQLMNVSPNGAYFYHTAGYVIVATAICKAVYSAGLSALSIPKILHGINLIVQLLTLLLLYRIGKQMVNRHVGLLSMALFSLFPLAVMEARYERIESWLCFLATAVIYVSLYFRRAPKASSFLMGLLIGLSMATKFSQLYLGIIPFILLINFFVSNRQTPLSTRSINLFMYSGLILAGIVLAIAINAPYIFLHFSAFVATIKDIQGFYTTPNYPYAEEYYSYTRQLTVTGRYFLVTLGTGWILFFLTGATAALHRSVLADPNTRLTAITIAAPVIVLIFYFALQVNFIERNFSALEGFISIVTALGIYIGWERVSINKFRATTTAFILAGIIAWVFYTPLMLDFVFINNHIKKTAHSGQTEFQNRMKEDFPGFWIKNLSHTHNISFKVPEKPEKAPRIYQIEDLNEYRAKQYLDILKNNGFIHMAQYCSDFHDMPPNTLTIYHAAAKNNYFIRKDEWPENLPMDYFNTNCQ